MKGPKEEEEVQGGGGGERIFIFDIYGKAVGFGLLVDGGLKGREET